MLYHHESASRGKALHPPGGRAAGPATLEEVFDRGDPYYNPNLSRTREDFSLDV